MTPCGVCGGRLVTGSAMLTGLCTRCHVRLVLGLPERLVARYRARWLGQVLP